MTRIEKVEVTWHQFQTAMTELEDLLQRYPTHEDVQEGYTEGVLFRRDKVMLELIIDRFLTPQ